MRIKLLFISAIALLCVAFVCENNFSHLDDLSAEERFEIISDHLSDQEISAPDKKLQVPRQTCVNLVPQCRTVTKRQSNTSNSKHQLYLSGRQIVPSFIRTYQLILDQYPAGLDKASRRLISLGKLII